MPTSKDPEKRARQVANLVPGAGAGDGGHQRGRTHGIRAAVTDGELEAGIAAVSAALPIKDPDGNAPASVQFAVRQLAEVMVRRERCAVELDARGLERPDGGLRAAVEYDARLMNVQLRLMVELGLTTRSQAALGFDVVRAQSAQEALRAHIAAKYGGDGGNVG